MQKKKQPVHWCKIQNIQVRIDIGHTTAEVFQMIKRYVLFICFVFLWRDVIPSNHSYHTTKVSSLLIGRREKKIGYSRQERIRPSTGEVLFEGAC